MSYPGEWAVLDGHISSPNIQVLDVRGGNVTYKDFEVTYSNVIRTTTTPNFTYCGGINHALGEDCSFINLIIHEVPGDAFQTWKETGGTFIYGCLVYNNGYIDPTATRKQNGPGFYVQNRTDKQRILKNNIVFNNFSVGFEVWSAETAPTTSDYVKNVTLEDNTVFNSGSPYRSSSDSNGDNNILVATADQTGLNTVKNVQVLKNVMYHNTDYATDIGTQNEGNSLEVGADDYHYPSQNITVSDNFISGRNSGVRLLELGSSTTFTNNYVLGRYVNYNEMNVSRISTDWVFDNNKYFTQYLNGFRKVDALGHAVPPDLTLGDWQTNFGIDLLSIRKPLYLINTPPANYPPNVLQLTRNEYNRNRFKVALFNFGSSSNVAVDFRNYYSIPAGTAYSIRDIESYTTVASTGTMPANSTVTFNLNLTSPPFLTPTGTDFVNSAARTPDNFGVFYIDFAPFFYANDNVYSTKLQADGKVIFGGDFTDVNGFSSNKIARLNTDMTFDSTFAVGTGANNSVLATAIQADGKIIVGGKFTSYNGSTKNGIIRLNSNGSLDTTFLVGTGLSSLGYVNAIAIQPDGKILIAGNFTTYNGTARIHIARLNTSGTLDTTFNSGFSTASSTEVFSLAIQADGKIIVGGTFTSYASTTRSNIVRLTSSGAIDTAFNPGTGFNGSVLCLKIQSSDGKVLSGGSYTSFNAVTRKYVSRLNTDGTLDTVFVPDAISFPAGGFGVRTIDLQTDGKIFIGGGFKTVGSYARNRIARLNSNGTTDSTFDPGTGFSPSIGFRLTAAQIYSIAIQADGKIVTGGKFDKYNGIGVDNITRLNPVTIGGLGRHTNDSASLEQREDILSKIDLANSTLIYPNPASEYFKISSPNIKIDYIEVYDKNQRLVKSRSLIGFDEKIAIDDLRPDTYYVKLYNNGDLLKTEKLVK